MGLLETLARTLPAIAADGPAAATRAEALALALAQGTPGLRDEDWRYTDLATATGPAYQPAVVGNDAGLALPLAALEGPRIVFINGRHAPAHDARATLPEGVQARFLERDGGTDPAWAAGCLAHQTQPGTRPFVALNAAATPDGLILDIAPGTQLAAPLVVIFATHGSANPVLTSPHLQINAGAGSAVSVIEMHIGTAEVPSLANAYTRLVTGAGARVQHYRVVQDSAQASHLGTVHLEVGRDSEVENFSLALAGRLVRVDLDARLAGTGGSLRLNGVFLAGRDEHVDHHTRVEHLADHTTSEETYHGIAEHNGRGVFNGKIVVPAGVAKVVANQASHNLLLSSEAEIDTKPELEINANDLRCAHGATVGQLDEDGLFYLQSRGVPAEDARALLTFGFVQRLVASLPVTALQALVAQRFAAGNPRLARLLTGDL